MTPIAQARSRRQSPARVQAVDLHVGRRIRTRRETLGLSQSRLGSAVGVTYQQIQKYESGMSRVTAGRLHRIAVVLEAPVAWFFEELEV